MSRNNHELRHESRQRELSELATQRPELAAWLQPLRVSLGALAHEPFRAILPICSQARAHDAPLLHDAIVPVPAGALRAHVHAVLSAALRASHRSAIYGLDAVQLVELAVAHDHAALHALADEAGVDAPALNAAAQLAVVPLLLACAQALAPRAVADWPHGYCHVCGALPALAEMLGLERTRHLRCGRCGASWQSHVLLCAFCGERNHAQLGSLVPDGAAGQIAWVETCNSCRAYLKTRAALRGAAPEHILIEDVRTLELDLVAAERGYQKPVQGSYGTRVRFTSAASDVS